MAITEKQRISARQVLADIRSGVDCSELKRKYSLSDDALKYVLSKLEAAGVLTEADRQVVRGPLPEILEAASKEPGTSEPRCPACEAVHDAEATDCPKCGIVLSKFVPGLEREGHFPEPIADTQTTGRKWLIAGLCAIIVVAIVGAWFLLRSQPGTGAKIKPAPAALKLPTTEKAEPDTVPSGHSAAEEATETSDSAPPPEETAIGAERVIELTFSPEGFPLGLSVSQGSGLHLFQTPSPNQGFKKMPPETGDTRYYDEFAIAGRTFRVITEESNPPKFYLDANGNGDLTDDPGPFLGEQQGVVPNYYTLQLPYKQEKTGVPYRLWIFPSRMGGSRFYPACHWHGQLEVNGKAYKVVLFDGNADGDYSNDSVVVDIDEDGKASETELLQVGRSISINGTTIKLSSVAPSGRWVRFQFQGGGPQESSATGDRDQR
jgi:hypothetical protein